MPLSMDSELLSCINWGLINVSKERLSDFHVNCRVTPAGSCDGSDDLALAHASIPRPFRIQAVSPRARPLLYSPCEGE